MTIKQLEKKYQDKGLLIGHAKEWLESLQTAEQYYNYSIPKKRCYGILIYGGIGKLRYCPKKCFSSLKEIEDFINK